MYSIKVIVKPTKDIFFKEGYEKVAKLIRLFIDKNGKGLKESHYINTFSYYSFGQMYPFEQDKIYKKDNVYTFEIKTVKDEFKDLRKFKGLSSDELTILDVTFTKLFYNPTGELKSNTPVYIGLGVLTKENKGEFENWVRENMIFKYLKNGNEETNIEELRKTLVKEINFSNRFITIPFSEKKNNKGGSILYHCYNVEVKFQDNDLAKSVEKIIYGSGLGRMTSNGFGYME